MRTLMLLLTVTLAGCETETGMRDVLTTVELPVLAAEAVPVAPAVVVDHVRFECHRTTGVFGARGGGNPFEYPPDEQLTEFLRVGVALTSSASGHPVDANVHLTSSAHAEDWTFHFDLADGVSVVDAADGPGSAYAEWDDALGEEHWRYNGVRSSFRCDDHLDIEGTILLVDGITGLDLGCWSTEELEGCEAIPAVRFLRD